MSNLNDHEAARVREIALWKSERPSFLLESYRDLSRPFSKLLARVVPKALVGKALAEVEALAETHEAMADILRAGGVAEVRELLARPLEECDRLSEMVSVRSEHLALLEGVVPAVGGLALPVGGEALTAAVDVPFLLQATLRAVRRIGHCYGFPLDTEADRRFVLAVLDIANEDGPAGPEEDRLRIWDPDGPARRKADGSDSADDIEQAMLDDLPLESVPFVGDVSNLVLDYAFVRRADVTARRVFQERWLRENGKVESIPPSPEGRRRSSIEGVACVASELAYVGAYGVAFGATFPTALAGSLVESVAPVAVLRGFRDGASAAARDSKGFLEGLARGGEPTSRETPALAPATA